MNAISVLSILQRIMTAFITELLYNKTTDNLLYYLVRDVNIPHFPPSDMKVLKLHSFTIAICVPSIFHVYIHLSETSNIHMYYLKKKWNQPNLLSSLGNFKLPPPSKCRQEGVGGKGSGRVPPCFLHSATYHLHSSIYLLPE